jgi:hypothetical protein
VAAAREVFAASSLLLDLAAMELHAFHAPAISALVAGDCKAVLIILDRKKLVAVNAAGFFIASKFVASHLILLRWLVAVP